jgi:hypothetical protein
MTAMSDTKEPFAFGEGTLMQLRDQQWEFDELGTRMIGRAPQPAPQPVAEEEMGTQIIPPPQSRPEGVTQAAPIESAAAATSSADPLVRIEHRLEELTRAVLLMQRRLDSIDAAMARFLTR